MSALAPEGVDYVCVFRDDATWAALAEATAHFYHEDVECRMVRFDGEATYKGLESLRAAWLDWLTPWASYRVEIHDVVDLGDRVLVPAYNLGRLHGSTEEIRMDGAAVLTLRRREDHPRRVLRRPRRGPQSGGAGGVGDVAGDVEIARGRSRPEPAARAGRLAALSTRRRAISEQGAAMDVIRFLRRCAGCGASLVLVTTAALGSAAPASASRGVSFQPFYEFTIAFRGQGSYTRTNTAEGGSTLKEEASWSWNTVYPYVLIPTTASSPLASAGFPAVGLGQEGDGKWTITNTGSENENCSNSGTLGLPKQAGGGGGGAVTVKRPAGSLSRGVIFNMTALDHYETTSGEGNGLLPCDPEDFWHDTIESFAGVGYKHTDPSLPD